MASRFRLPALLVVLSAVAAVMAVTASRPAQAQQQSRVAVGDTWFCDASFQGGVCETVIEAGDTVAWDFAGAQLSHTSTECGASCDSPTASPLWDSGTISGGTFQFTFTQPGTYRYYCEVHGASAMQGRIVVQAAAQPTNTPVPPGPTAVDLVAVTATPATGALPTSGQGPDGGSSAGWWLWSLLGFGAALALLGAATYRRPRRPGAG